MQCYAELGPGKAYLVTSHSEAAKSSLSLWYRTVGEQKDTGVDLVQITELS